MGKKNKNQIFGRVKRKKCASTKKIRKVADLSSSDPGLPLSKHELDQSSSSTNAINPKKSENANVDMDISINSDSKQSSIETSFTEESENNTSVQVDTDTATENNSDTEYEFTVEEEVISQAPLKVEGRRVVSLQYLLDQLIEISKHGEKFNCRLDFLEIIKEKKYGLKSTFELRCGMCQSRFKLCTHDEQSISDVNHSAVSGTILMGCGLSNLHEFTASMDLPLINQKIYKQCHGKLYNWWEEAAEKSMADAALEETESAFEKTATGKPMIAVTADACWGKRSYKNNYSSLSGVGAIIGINSGKVLHVGIKNKYCVICARATNKNCEPHEHECNINHRGSSTSMEQTAIVEGFKQSEEKHGLIYSKLIADGDASTYKNILESRPYPELTVQKIECSNHLLRNYNGKIMNLSKDTSIPLYQRKLLNADRIKRLRVAVKQAVRFRIAQNLPFDEQVRKLRRDILNSPKHVFGEHSDCEDYYCSAERKLETNNVPNVSALMTKLMANTANLAQHSQSLMYKQNNNRAEQFNSLVAKYVGGKRVNYALKDSYALRCYAAVVAFNTGMPIYTLHKTITGKSPSKSIKTQELRKRANNSRKKVWKPKRTLVFSKNVDYGESCQKPDLTPEEYERKKTRFLDGLKIRLSKRDEIQEDTVAQSESALWLELRRSLLTASNFAKVCKRRSNKSPAPLVKAMLYSYSLDHVAAIKHGKSNESRALTQLASQENIVIQNCGLHIDQNLFFLGATPDGKYDGGIIEVKCPSSAFGMEPDEAIRQKKIRMWNIVKGKMIINQNHDWYYQIQGQLHITNKKKCLFAVWTGPDHRLKTEVIEKDDNFWAKMENRLIQFYEKCLLPELVDPRKTRSMSLRDEPF